MPVFSGQLRWAMHAFSHTKILFWGIRGWVTICLIIIPSWCQCFVVMNAGLVASSLHKKFQLSPNFHDAPPPHPHHPSPTLVHSSELLRSLLANWSRTAHCLPFNRPGNLRRSQTFFPPIFGPSKVESTVWSKQFDKTNITKTGQLIPRGGQKSPKFGTTPLDHFSSPEPLLRPRPASSLTPPSPSHHPWEHRHPPLPPGLILHSHGNRHSADGESVCVRRLVVLCGFEASDSCVGGS